MSELIERLAARSLSDIRRGVTFAEGMRNFAQLIHETTQEMDRQVKHVEALVATIEARK